MTTDSTAADMAKILNGVANAIYGPPPEGRLHGWGDLPERVRALVLALVRAVATAEPAKPPVDASATVEARPRGGAMVVECHVPVAGRYMVRAQGPLNPNSAIDGRRYMAPDALESLAKPPVAASATVEARPRGGAMVVECHVPVAGWYLVRARGPLNPGSAIDGRRYMDTSAALESLAEAPAPMIEIGTGAGKELPANRFDCPHCGHGVKVDEDGCCSSCGAACSIFIDGRLLGRLLWSQMKRGDDGDDGVADRLGIFAPDPSDISVALLDRMEQEGAPLEELAAVTEVGLDDRAVEAERFAEDICKRVGARPRGAGGNTVEAYTARLYADAARRIDLLIAAAADKRDLLALFNENPTALWSQLTAAKAQIRDLEKAIGSAGDAGVADRLDAAEPLDHRRAGSKAHVEVWDAIADIVTASGGDNALLSSCRMDCVARIEGAIDARVQELIEAAKPPPPGEHLIFEAPVDLAQARDRDVAVTVPRALLRRVVAQQLYALGFLGKAFQHQAVNDFNAGYMQEMESTIDACCQLASIDPDDEDLDD